MFERKFTETFRFRLGAPITTRFQTRIQCFRGVNSLIFKRERERERGSCTIEVTDGESDEVATIAFRGELVPILVL